MNVVTLQVEGFRNIEAADLLFQTRNLLVGPNGAGKTSIAEAVAVAMNGRSFRTFDLAMLLRRGADYWRTVATVNQEDNSTHRIAISATSQQRERVKLDDRNVRITQLATDFPVVTFIPEDRDLVVGLPGIRREYLDSILARSNPSVYRLLSRAAKILKQRRNLIRSNNPDIVTLDIFDEELASASILISDARENLLGYLQGVVEEFNQRITGRSEEVCFRYLRSWKNDPLSDLKASRSYDFRTGSTSVGFHRDDFIIELNGLPAKSTASQGQIRSLAIALRVGSAQVLQNNIGEPPLLILDDVFAEFDRSRAARLVTAIGQYQTIATNTEHVDIMDDWSVYEISGGRIVSH